MEKYDRKQNIVEIISKNGFVSVEELSAELYISPSSVRRDLAALEEKKLIKRIHGGATLVKDTKELSPFYARKATNIEQKRTAAEKAAYLIEDFMSVMIDGSTTALQMLPHLKNHRGIRIFTNSLHTYMSALDMGLEAYCFGGGPSADKETFSGSMTEDAVKKIYTDILFFSSKCINDKGDITDPIDSENCLRKVMLEHARIKVFLYDSSKLGTTALYKLCNVNDVDHSFSDVSDAE